MPPDISTELELLASIYSERGCEDKAAEIKSIILLLRSRELAAASNKAAGLREIGTDA